MQILLFLALAVKAGGKAAVVPVQNRVQQPVFLALEGLDLLLPVHHHPGGHGLDAPGGEALFHLPPQQRRELIAHDAVQDAPRLLGVHQILVDPAGMLDALGDDFLGDFVEGDALGLFLGQIQQFLEVPGDGLALAVRVGREIDGLGALGGLFQFVNELRLIAHGDILGLEAVFDVHAHLALGQIPQVAHGGRDLIVPTQIFFNGLRLGRRLHDHKILCSCHAYCILTFS